LWRIFFKEIFIKSTGMGKNTLYKFYDQLIVYIHAKGRKDKLNKLHFDNRRNEIKRFLKDRNIEIVNIELKGKNTAKPTFDKGVEQDLKTYFDLYHTISLENFKISNDEIGDDGRGGVVTHVGK
jgi:hypothetical protein